MPVSLSYPGVYVEELPSGVRSITGVATSIAAFVGRAQRGPTDQDGPVTIHSWADFERTFGGLWLSSPMSYAVSDFFDNGGSTAVIVRLYLATKNTDTTNASLSIPLTTGSLVLTARYPGAWGNNLQARIDLQTKDKTDKNLFNMSVRDAATGQVETFRNVSMATDSPRRVDRVLASDSTLVNSAVPTQGDTPVEIGPALPWTDPKIVTVPAAPDAAHVPDDGAVLTSDAFVGTGLEADKHGLYALEKADQFNLLCIPPHASDPDDFTEIKSDLIAKAATYCEKRRAILIVDPPHAWSSKDTATKGAADISSNVGTGSANAAIYFPRILEANPLRDGRVEAFAPCGAVAGVIARTAAQRGVWKAPAGLAAGLVGVGGPSIPLTDLENGDLNPLGVNCVRTMPAAGPVVWGARTMQGNDALASQWKYLPVRRTALYIEESLYRGTQWVVFEPNDEPLWSQIRLNVGSFMHDLFRQGAFQGQRPADAYFVKCDKESTTQSDINNGIVNIIVGFAPLKPAEFVVIQLQQMAGQVAV
jgi:Bacteriophage tail sheath protein